MSDTLPSIPPLAFQTHVFTADAATTQCKYLTWTCSLPEEVPRLVCTALKHNDLHDALVQEWERLHSLVLHKEQDVIPEDPEKKKSHEKPKCIDADGVCLCDERGCDMWAMEKCLLTWM